MSAVMTYERELRVRSAKKYNEIESDSDSEDVCATREACAVLDTCSRICPLAQAFLGPVGDPVDYAARLAGRHYSDDCVMKLHGKA